jgi:CO/xanthine dehydrogenase FAD-binding subunit
MGDYLRPLGLEEALAALDRRHTGRHPTVLAGGTDFYPARVGRTIDEDVLDITAVPELSGIKESDEGWRIGATATWSELIEAPLPPLFDGLKAAAREVGGRQIQNAGTIAGNLCNASPAADGVPPLLTLDAELELASRTGRRRLPLDRFILGNRRTALSANELAVAIHVPRKRNFSRGAFLKLGARKYLIISIVMVAAVLETADDEVVRARIAVGACSEVARRLPLLEAALTGVAVGKLADAVHPGHLTSLAPIDDLRASAAYRNDAVMTLLRRLLS